MYHYRFTKSCHKKLQKLNPQLQKRLIKKIKYFCQADPLYYAKQIKGDDLGQYRFRIGNYRVIFDLNKSKRLLTILDLGHRSTIYR